MEYSAEEGGGHLGEIGAHVSSKENLTADLTELLTLLMYPPTPRLCNAIPCNHGLAALCKNCSGRLGDTRR